MGFCSCVCVFLYVFYCCFGVLSMFSFGGVCFCLCCLVLNELMDDMKFSGCAASHNGYSAF